MALIKTFKKDHLQVKVFETRQEMGTEAARDVSAKIKSLLADQDTINMVFASAPSQNEFLAALVQEPGVEWERINAFHMDEYVGLEESAPQRFSQFLKETLFDKVPFKEVFYLNKNQGDSRKECQRYAKLLESHPTDIVCMGIGENAHIAFNDPHVADFNDPLLVKEVTLDDVSRQQQVNDGCFARLELVPETAITLTVPALLLAKDIYCVVPGKYKARAIYQTLKSSINEAVPATALRKHERVMLYLDQESASKL
ncbi:MAG: glucosamine-6-phosphate deaminase [Sphingobacteriaceae bacterium]